MENAMVAYFKTILPRYHCMNSHKTHKCDSVGFLYRCRQAILRKTFGVLGRYFLIWLGLVCMCGYRHYYRRFGDPVSILKVKRLSHGHCRFILYSSTENQTLLSTQEKNFEICSDAARGITAIDLCDR